jgi:acetylglutamate kinase
MQNQALIQALIEALPYIQQFAGATAVIKYGGAAMIDTTLKTSFAQDISLLRHLGLKIIVIHGGGKEITTLAEKLNIKSHFVSGRRVTDEQMLDVAKMVLAGKVNKEIVCNLNRQNVNAVGISGQDGNLLKCRKHYLENGQDIGWVGEIINVNTDILKRMLNDGIIPVIAPIGYDDEGNSYNINADSAAGAIAGAIPAEKLIFISDVSGVLREEKLISTITEEESIAMIASGEISKGMIPKVNSAFDTLHQGVKKVHMVDGRVLHSLLVEIYTDSGIGTQFVLQR